MNLVSIDGRKYAEEPTAPAGSVIRVGAGRTVPRLSARLRASVSAVSGKLACHRRPPAVKDDAMEADESMEEVEDASTEPLSSQSSGVPGSEGDGAVLRQLVHQMAMPSKPPALPVSSSSESLAPPTPAIDGVADAVGAAVAPAAGRVKCAYVTLLTRDSYLPGVQALARSLQAAEARYPLVVMYTADTLSLAAVDALVQEGCHMLSVERYRPAGSHDFSQYKLQIYGECWTKLRMWEMEQYDRLAYIDADTLVIRNIDALFDLPHGFYAVGDCMAGRKTKGERHGCPLFCPSRPHYFNAGFYLMSPSRAELALFNSLLASGAVEIGGYAEQDFLNEVYKDTWRPLPHTFNAQKGIRCHHPQLWWQCWQDVAIIHYTDAKPWQLDHPDNEPFQDLVELWWKVFEGRQPAAVEPAVPVPLR